MCTPCLDFQFHPHVDDPSGKQGAGQTTVTDATVATLTEGPRRTVVLDGTAECSPILVGEGTRFEAAAGGRGGLGNAALSVECTQAPGSRCRETGQTRDSPSN